mgnify:CR=1 FL=1
MTLRVFKKSIYYVSTKIAAVATVALLAVCAFPINSLLICRKIIDYKTSCFPLGKWRNYTKY